jgi:hypothetical protein
MPPYKELYPVGTKVRVAGRAKLDDFLRTWKFHHPLPPEQLLDADRIAEVVSVAFYHGGDVLYGLRDVPGTWHEEWFCQSGSSTSAPKMPPSVGSSRLRQSWSEDGSPLGSD